MRKGFLLALFFLMSTPLSADVDGHTEHGPLTRVAIVEARGWINAGAIPLVEIPRATATEIRLHHWWWPVTFIPRIFANLAIRIVSSFNDIAFYPWIVPFTDDISPLTEPMGLPEYPWQGWGD